MRKLLASSLMVIGTVSAVALATRAFFSDTETATGNTFTAGEIDLQIDSQASYNGLQCEKVGDVYQWVAPQDWVAEDSYEQSLVNQPCTGSFSFTDLDVEKFFSFADIKPGDSGENTISMHVINNDAWACMNIGGAVDAENGENESEAEADTVAGGELSDNMMFFSWVDTNGDNVYQVGERILFGPALASAAFNKSYAIADSSVGSPLVGNDNPALATSYIGMQWCAGTLSLNAGVLECDGVSMGNEAQTDGMTADIGFTVTQARNNDEYVCPNAEPAAQLVGAALGAYVQPQNCSDTVEGSDSLQAAVNGASSSQTICVDPSYLGTGDTSYITVNVPNLTIAGLGTTQSAVVGKGIQIAANNVKVTGLTFNNYLSQASLKAALYIKNNTTGTEISYNKILAPAGAKGADAKGILTEIGNGSIAGAMGITVKHNVIQDWRQGIFFNTANYDVGYNDFYNNDVGVANDGPHASSIHHNDFENNVLEAVGVNPSAKNGTARDGILAVNFNNFSPANAGNNVNWYGSSILGTADVNAANNWWSGEVEASRTNNTTEVETEPAAAVAYPEN